jgi:hypothetical protein
MTVPRLTPERRRALQILAEAGINGATETTLLAHGFTRVMLAVLMRKGLVRARRETIMAGGKTIEVYRVRITTVGRRALES